jgi:chlorite dismutase
MTRTTKIVAISMDYEDYEYLKSLRLRPSDLIRDIVWKLREDELKKKMRQDGQPNKQN